MFVSFSRISRPLTRDQETKNGLHRKFCGQQTLTIIRDATAKSPSVGHAHGEVMNANTPTAQARQRHRSSKSTSPSSRTAFATWKIHLNHLHPCSWQTHTPRNPNLKLPTIQVTTTGLSDSQYQLISLRRVPCRNSPSAGDRTPYTSGTLVGERGATCSTPADPVGPYPSWLRNVTDPFG